MKKLEETQRPTQMPPSQQQPHLVPVPLPTAYGPPIVPAPAENASITVKQTPGDGSHPGTQSYPGAQSQEYGTHRPKHVFDPIANFKSSPHKMRPSLGQSHKNPFVEKT